MIGCANTWKWRCAVSKLNFIEMEFSAQTNCEQPPKQQDIVMYENSLKVWITSHNKYLISSIHSKEVPWIEFSTELWSHAIILLPNLCNTVIYSLNWLVLWSIVYYAACSFKYISRFKICFGMQTLYYEIGLKESFQYFYKNFCGRLNSWKII